MNWRECRRNQPWPKLRNYPGTYLEGPRKTTKTWYNSRPLSSKLRINGPWSCKAHDLLTSQGHGGCAGCRKTGRYVIANYHGSGQKCAQFMAGSWILLLTWNFVHYGYIRKWLVAWDVIKGQAAHTCLVQSSLGKHCVRLFSEQYDQKYYAGILYPWYKLFWS